MRAESGGGSEGGFSLAGLQSVALSLRLGNARMLVAHERLPHFQDALLGLCLGEDALAGELFPARLLASGALQACGGFGDRESFAGLPGAAGRERPIHGIEVRQTLDDLARRFHGQLLGACRHGAREEEQAGEPPEIHAPFSKPRQGKGDATFRSGKSLSPGFRVYAEHAPLSL